MILVDHLGGGSGGEKVAFESRDILVAWKRTLIILISKQPDASIPEHFKPISFCTILYKVCARVLIGRLKVLMLYLISPKQDAFVGG